MKVLLTLIASFLFTLISFSQFIDSPKTHQPFQEHKQVADSIYFSAFNKDISEWEVLEKHLFTYNDSARITSLLSYIWNAELQQFQNYTKTNTAYTNYIYNNTINTYCFINDEWESNYKISYNNQDNLVLFDTVFSNDDTELNFLYLNEYKYDDNDSVSVIYQKKWDTISSTWLSYKVDSFYYTQDIKSQHTSLYDTATSSFYKSTEYLYYISNTLDSICFYAYDTALQSLLKEQIITYKYSQDFIESYSVLIYDNELEEYQIVIIDSFFYDENNLLTSKECWRIQDANLNKYCKEEYQYNSLNSLINSQIFLWNADNEWEIHTQKEYFLSEIYCTLQASLSEHEAISCYGSTDGEISVSVQGGTTPYLISWENADFSQDSVFVNAVANQYYRIKVRDKNLCQISDSILLSEPNLLNFTFDSVKHVSCSGSNDAYVNIDVSGGTAPYQYIWNNTDTLLVENQNQLNIDEYNYIIVIDENGCFFEDSIYISEPDSLKFEIDDYSNLSCFEEQDGFVSFNITGGTEPYLINWNNEWENDFSFENLSANIYYTYLIKDVNDCMIEDSIMFSQPDKVETSEIVGADSSVILNDNEYMVTQTAESMYFWEVAGGNVKYGQGTYLVLVEWESSGQNLISVVERDKNECFGDSVFHNVLVTLTDVDIINEDNTHIFPNPVTEKLFIQIPKNQIVLGYKLYDALGNIVKEDNHQNQEYFIDRGNLESGVYYLNLLFDQPKTYKIVVQ